MGSRNHYHAAVASTRFHGIIHLLLLGWWDVCSNRCRFDGKWFAGNDSKQSWCCGVALHIHSHLYGLRAASPRFILALMFIRVASGKMSEVVPKPLDWLR